MLSFEKVPLEAQVVIYALQYRQVYLCAVMFCHAVHSSGSLPRQLPVSSLKLNIKMTTQTVLFTWTTLRSVSLQHSAKR